MPLWGNWVELRGEYRRSVPARALRAAMRAFPGFQGNFSPLRFGAMGRFYAPLGRLRGRCVGSCGGEEDCRVVPAGSSGVAALGYDW